jgi:hypothetical protein
MKMGFASYNETSAKLIPNMGQDQQDITCPDDYNFCSTAKWKNASWSNGNHPSLNWNNPPQKDTIIVPTGGYVVIRFKAIALINSVIVRTFTYLGCITITTIFWYPVPFSICCNGGR